MHTGALAWATLSDDRLESEFEELSREWSPENSYRLEAKSRELDRETGGADVEIDLLAVRAPL